MNRRACVLSHLGGCGGGMHDHHVVPQRKIKDEHRSANATGRVGFPTLLTGVSLRRVLDDPRNRFRICSDHHGRIEAGHGQGDKDRRELLKVIRRRMDELQAFAVEFGLWRELDHALAVMRGDRVRTRS